MSNPALEDSRQTHDTETEASSLPGFWMTVLGVVLAVLAPLAGFLGGSTTASTGDRSETVGLWLMIGLVVGGVGVLIAFIGGSRWWRAAHRSVDGR